MTLPLVAVARPGFSRARARSSSAAAAAVPYCAALTLSSPLTTRLRRASSDCCVPWPASNSSCSRFNSAVASVQGGAGPLFLGAGAGIGPAGGVDGGGGFGPGPPVQRRRRFGVQPGHDRRAALDAVAWLQLDALDRRRHRRRDDVAMMDAGLAFTADRDRQRPPGDAAHFHLGRFRPQGHDQEDTHDGRGLQDSTSGEQTPHVA